MLGVTEIELVRKGYDAFVAGDMEWLNDHLHENVVWHVPGDNPQSGDHRGREQTLAALARAVEDAVPELDIHDVAAGEDHVVALLRVTWRKPDDRTFSTNTVQVFHLDGDRLVESWLITEDQPGLDAFLNGATP
jgi:ketosteroid isomerase-like protein